LCSYFAEFHFINQKKLSCVSLQARLQRGQLLLKQGKFDEAEDDFKNVVSWGPKLNYITAFKVGF